MMAILNLTMSMLKSLVIIESPRPLTILQTQLFHYPPHPTAHPHPSWVVRYSNILICFQKVCVKGAFQLQCSQKVPLLLLMTLGHPCAQTLGVQVPHDSEFSLLSLTELPFCVLADLSRLLIPSTLSTYRFFVCAWRPI